MFSKGKKSSVKLEDITSKLHEADILSYYLGIKEIPCVINSPLRKDKRPSFGLYSPNGERIYYTDLSTKEHGGIYDLLGKLWYCDFEEVLIKIYEDIPKICNKSCKVNTTNTMKNNDNSTCRILNKDEYRNTIDIQCKIRNWKDHDIEYWKSYGIDLKWLNFADVYPISHKIIIKDNKKYIFNADKYAYAYIERKEGKISIKIYQPFNKDGYKWSNSHNGSVISLWTKIPEYGDKLCICSSLKDALCLMANAHISSLALQGEGYRMSDTAIKELKRRYKKIFICFDNDDAGIQDAVKLSKETGFINVVLPQFVGGKDISDYYKLLGKKKWLEIINAIFSLHDTDNIDDDLPF